MIRVLCFVVHLDCLAVDKHGDIVRKKVCGKTNAN